jgi:uncharacterized OsmC-like protein
MGSEDSSFTIDLQQQADYRFGVRFDTAEVPPLTVDEGPPLGHNAGPSPTRLLATAVAHCLSASLLFALRKLRIDAGPLHTRATVQLVRNEQRRLRVGQINVALTLGASATTLPTLGRALAIFEDYCVVTQSVRQGIPVQLRVLDSQGVQVHPTP